MTNEELYYLPASELLKHIQAKKERLIKEKVIKKSKPLPPITEEEKPYELPEGWEWVRLSDVINIVYGTRIVKKTAKEGNYPVYGGGDITFYVDTYNRDTAIVVSRFGLSKKCTRYIKGRFFLNDSGLSLHTFNEMCLRTMYIKFLIESLQEQIFELSRGAAQRNLDIDKFNNLLIPFPPLYIQDQIVQKLEQLSEIKDSLLSHAESQLNYTQKMREALLQEAIRGELVPQDENDEPASVLLEKIKAEKEVLRLYKKARKDSEFPEIESTEIPFEIPSHWKWIRIGEIGIYKKGPFGSALKKSLFVPKSEDTVKVFEQKNAIQKDITLGDYYISKDYFEANMTGFEVFPGDILVSCAGTIGETYVVPQNSEKGIINQALMRMNIVNSVNLNYFLYYFDFILKNTAQESSKGSAIKNIPPFDVFKKLLFPLPPLAEQERIVDKLDALMAHCDQLEVKAEEMKQSTIKLFEASLKEAFMPE